MTPDQDKLGALVAETTENLHALLGDPFRRQYAPLTDQQRQFVDGVRDEAISVYATISMLKPSRERALALTHLEEAIMWATKAATAKEGA